MPAVVVATCLVGSDTRERTIILIERSYEYPLYPPSSGPAVDPLTSSEGVDGNIHTVLYGTVHLYIELYTYSTTPVPQLTCAIILRVHAHNACHTVLI